MKKTIIFSLAALTLYANSDYIPISELSNDKKFEYNFVNKNNSIEQVESEKYESVSKENNVEIKEIKVDIIEDIPENKELIENKEFVKEYKKENILQDSRNKTNNTFSKDFSITPKFTYSYLKADFFATDRVSVVDKKGIFIPEITVSYKNHNLKAEGFEAKSYFNKVLISGSDLETTIKWNKLYYLYSYNNINLGIAYNNFDIKFYAVNDNVILKDQQKFPSFELHMKNSNDILQAEYGFSYGKNNDISYSSEYYLNVGYKLLKDNELILSAGYKNRTIEYNFPEKDTEYKYEFEGPTLSLAGTF